MDNQQPTIQFEKPKNKNFWPLIGSLAILIITAVIFFILNKYCVLQPQWLLLVLLLDYLTLLTINYSTWFKKKRWIFSLFLTLMPALLLVVTLPWGLWFWVLLIILYLITLLQYFIKSITPNAWSVIIPLTLLMALMIFKLQRFNCLG
ncbi:MAG TPA: hypothetical protein PLH37_01620 [bacterium]|nr:hypothetical protein [bacterium]